MRVNMIKPFAIFLAFFAIVSLACSNFNSSPEPEPQSAPVEPVQTEEPVKPTETSDPVQAQEPPETSQPSAEQFYTEDFDTDSGYWDINVVNNSNAADTSKASAEISDGRFNFMIDGKQLTIYSFYTPYEYQNVKIDLWVENRGSNDNQINIICRATEDGWYEFSIANNGLYKIYVVEPGKGYRKLHDGGSTKIKAGREFNEYTVICNERTMSLFVNGTETRVFEENEYAFSEGLIGIGVSSFNNVPVEIEVDSVTISEP
jgi:hypothetical protein